MQMPTADPVITSFATSATSQPQPTNTMTANPLATPLLLNQFPAGYPLFNPLLSQPNLHAAGFAGGASAAGVGGAVNPAAAAAASNAPDPNVELANALSRLMFGSAAQSFALPMQQNLLAGMTGLLAPGAISLLSTAALQRLMSGNSGTSLLSPSVQQQLLVNAGGQTTAVHGGSATPMSSVVTTTTATPVSSSAPAVHRNDASVSAQAQAAAGRPLFESSRPTRASQYQPPRPE